MNVARNLEGYFDSPDDAWDHDVADAEVSCPESGEPIGLDCLEEDD